MSEQASTFQAKSTIKAADREHRRKINFNIARYNAVVPAGKQQFTNVHLARERAKNAKWRAIGELDKTLETYEAAAIRNGCKVLYAETAQEALDQILEICKAKSCRSIVKSKSMVTEELHL
ncbi:MAG: [Fe-S]-binding protein, partial [Chitinophagaceae bacterium]